jgi:hypothetical protein
VAYNPWRCPVVRSTLSKSDDGDSIQDTRPRQKFDRDSTFRRARWENKSRLAQSGTIGFSSCGPRQYVR